MDEDQRKTKAQLIAELDELRQRITVLEASAQELDVTKAALQESKDLFSAVWECASDAMVLSDAQGVVTAANAAYLELYGYSAPDVIGQDFAIILPEAERDAARAQYKAVFASPEIPPAFESIIQRADGTERIVESRIGFIVRERQRIALLSIIRDITERRQIEQALRQSHAHLLSIVEKYR